MTGKLLFRGMLVGLLAGILSFGFLKTFGEPQVDRAIAVETQLDEEKVAAKAKDDLAHGIVDPKEDAEPELVSRPVQAGIGLFTGVGVYSAAFGGLFALAFTAVYGRIGRLSARSTSALLGAAAFISIYLIPNLKYPANPPSVGEPETIRIRTALYFSMIAISVAAMIIGIVVRLRITPQRGAWNATLIGAAIYLVIVAGATMALPGVNEVPEAFPATVLWQFRVASMGAQLILWGTLGLGFGAVLEHSTLGVRQLRLSAAV